jgi:opacity protein-like surface antigen
VAWVRGRCPNGDFAEAAGTGFGALGHAFITPEHAPFGLRIDGSVLVYGSESFTVPFSGTGGRVGVDVTTDNWIAHLGAGPQFAVRSGPIRPYVNATLGFSYFATTSDVKGEDAFEPIASSTNYDDWTFRWSIGGGVNVPLGDSVALDLGVAWVSNSRVSYLTEGDVQDDGAGGIEFTPRRSEADLVQYTVGITGGW